MGRNPTNNGLGFSHAHHQPSGSTGEGIEADILPESAFPSVAWLRQYGMYMFRWAGDSNEWTEYAMHIPSNVAAALFGPDFVNQGPLGIPALAELQAASGCKMWLDKETLRGREEPFLVFMRGPAGQPSNGCMNMALEMLSNKMKVLLPGAGQPASSGPPMTARVNSFGSMSSGSAPGRPQPALGLGLDQGQGQGQGQVQGQQGQGQGQGQGQHNAWGVSLLSSMSSGADN